MSETDIDPPFAVLTQVPGVYHRRVGEVVISAVSDGYVLGSMNVLRNIDLNVASAMLARAYRPIPRQTSVNCYVVHTADHTILIDAGCGYSARPRGGRLLENLAVAGILPNQVDKILMTHLHPDHAGGLTDEQGEAVFPNADLLMHEDELAYWTSSEAEILAMRSGQGVPCFEGACRAVDAYGLRVKTFKPGTINAHIAAVHLPGHTPGHSGYRITSGGEDLLIWGDIVHIPEIQISLPDVALQLDVDPLLATLTRTKLFDEVSKTKPLIAGMHLHFPGFARLIDDPGLRLQPEPWRHDA